MNHRSIGRWDFAKPVKAIFLPQDVLSKSDLRLIKLENQVQHLMEAHLASKQPVQVNKISSSCEIYSSPHDTQYCMENPEQAFVDYAYQVKLERTLIEFDSHQERRLSSLGAQLGRQQDDLINKINILWKVFSEKPNDTSTRDTIGNSIAHMNVMSTDQIMKEELQSKGIKSPSKLLYPEYLSQASQEEQNRKPSSIKRVHFINSMTTKVEEKVEEESKDEFEEEIEEEEEEKEEDVEYFDTLPTLEELGYHEWLLKYPKPSWVKAKQNQKFE
ncbi:hypothetical protein Tco_1451728 [Tanacetum coccineum]